MENKSKFFLKFHFESYPLKQNVFRGVYNNFWSCINWRLSRSLRSCLQSWFPSTLKISSVPSILQVCWINTTNDLLKANCPPMWDVQGQWVIMYYDSMTSVLQLNCNFWDFYSSFLYYSDWYKSKLNVAISYRHFVKSLQS